MQRTDALREQIPDLAKDLRLNLQTVLAGQELPRDLTWGVAVAAAAFARHDGLRDALLADARSADVSEDVLEDALAAAALMAMNTTYYKFRHLVAKPVYQALPPRLRMQRIASPRSTKLGFELFSLACAAIAGCEWCVRSHEEAVTQAGLRPALVNEAMRVAAAVHGAGVALTLPRQAAVGAQVTPA